MKHTYTCTILVIALSTYVFVILWKKIKDEGKKLSHDCKCVFCLVCLNDNHSIDQIIDYVQSYLIQHNSIDVCFNFIKIHNC